MAGNGQMAFNREFDAIIAELSSIDTQANPVHDSTKKERLLDGVWDLIRSPTALEVEDKASHLIELSDVLHRVDPA